jgi:ribosomal-protein-alanine N-acetyltransferase
MIRPVEPQDLAPILRLTQLIPEAPAWSTEDFRKLVAAPQHLSANDSSLSRTAWVAESNARVLGLIVVQSLRISGESEPAQAECELESILVDPAARRLGLGQQLLSTAIAWCVQQHAAILRLEVRRSNQPAICLYEKFSFVRTGIRPRYYSAPEEDALLMQFKFPQA